MDIITNNFPEKGFQFIAHSIDSKNLKLLVVGFNPLQNLLGVNSTELF